MAERKPRKLPLKKSRSKTNARVGKVDRNSPIPGKFNAASQKAFLQALFDGMTVGKACALVGISRPAVYKRRDNDEAFADAWDDAQRMGHQERCDVIRNVMWERAVEGYEETEARQYLAPNGTKRTAIKRTKKVDNTLLVRLAEAHMPEEFRANVKLDKTVDVGEALADLMERARNSPQNSLGALIK